jgi:hypothetical protein
VRGWRRFRRLPGVLQAATWLALVAAYSLGMVLVLTGGDGDGDQATVGTPDRPKARPFTPLERQISEVIAGTRPGHRLPREETDVPRFRKPRVRSVTCEEDACDIVYTVGLPGRGRILYDQRPMWERLFSQTQVQKATMTVLRDAGAAGVPPKPGEESPEGAPLLRTTCDRSRHRNVDWKSAKGAQILQNICEVDGFEQGEVHRQEPVAPDDETAGGDPDLPRPTPGD